MEEKLKRKRRRRGRIKKKRRKLKSVTFFYNFYRQAVAFRIIHTLTLPYITNLRTVAMFVITKL